MNNLIKYGFVLLITGLILMLGFQLGYIFQQNVERTDCTGWLEYNNITIPPGRDCLAYRFNLKLAQPTIGEYLWGNLNITLPGGEVK